MSKETQNKDFWRERIKEGGGVERGMAVGFQFQTIIDPIHREYVRKYIKDTDKVLDAGCGYGRNAHWFKDEQYKGVDFLEEFISEAKKRNPSKKFYCVDLAKLPFNKKQFDWGVLVSVRVVIRSDPDGEKKWKKVEKELRRVCKQILILEYGNSIPEEIHKAFEIL